MPAMFLYDTVVIFQPHLYNVILGTLRKLVLGIHLLCLIFTTTLTKWKRFLTMLFTLLD